MKFDNFPLKKIHNKTKTSITQKSWFYLIDSVSNKSMIWKKIRVIREWGE